LSRYGSEFYYADMLEDDSGKLMPPDPLLAKGKKAKKKKKKKGKAGSTHKTVVIVVHGHGVDIREADQIFTAMPLHTIPFTDLLHWGKLHDHQDEQQHNDFALLVQGYAVDAPNKELRFHSRHSHAIVGRLNAYAEAWEFMTREEKKRVGWGEAKVRASAVSRLTGLKKQPRPKAGETPSKRLSKTPRGIAVDPAAAAEAKALHEKASKMMADVAGEAGKAVEEAVKRIRACAQEARDADAHAQAPTSAIASIDRTELEASYALCRAALDKIAKWDTSVSDRTRRLAGLEETGESGNLVEALHVRFGCCM
jgi:hypothetical protein